MTRQRHASAALAGILALIFGVLAGCGTSAPSAPLGSGSTGSSTPGSSAPPDWYSMRMRDVRTGQAFAIGDFAGKVVLVETMAEWCPTCREQQAEVGKLHDLLGSGSDVVSISLDIDVHEDEASLKEYAGTLGYDWRFAVAPLEVARALGNLYSAEYLNPPYSPILLIDRHGTATSLPYGVKTAALLKSTLDPYLAP